LVCKYGHVEQCRIKRDIKGRSQEEAIVVYRDNASADNAKKEMDGNQLDSRTIQVGIYKKIDVAAELLQDNTGNQQVVAVHQPHGIQRRNVFRKEQGGRGGFRSDRTFNRDRRGSREFRGRGGRRSNWW